MSLTVSFDGDFGELAGRVAQATGQAAGEVVREEGRMVVADLVLLTPPLGSEGDYRTESQRVRGEYAVRHDVRRLFRPVSRLARGGKTKWGAQLQAAIGRGDLSTVQTMLRRAGIRGEVVQRATKGLHRSKRNEKGRIPRGGDFFWVLDEGSVESYVESAVDEVGKAKAGWETAANGLNVRLDDWISRHSTPGRFEDRTSDSEEPSLTIGNDVPYGDDFAGLDIGGKAMERAAVRLQARTEKRMVHTVRSLGVES